MSQLNDHARHLALATGDLLMAKRRRDDEVSAPRPWYVRLWDVFVQTEKERDLALAEARLEEQRAATRAALVQFLATAEQNFLSAGTAVVQPAVQAKAVLDRAALRAQRFSGLLDQAQGAVRALNEAADSCSTAHTMETIDFASSNKGISAMSMVYTSDASSDVGAARRKLASLRDSLSSLPADQGLSSAPNDLADFAVDVLAPDIGFDALSLLNMFALSDTEASCRAAIKGVEPVVERLEKIAASAQSSQVAAQAEFDRLMDEPRRNARSMLPPEVLALL